MNSTLIIRGASVWTGGQSATVQEVVVREGRIASLGAPTSTAELDDAEIVDGAGCTLLPGLIDAHVHLTTPSESCLPRANADFRANAEPAEKALHGYRNAKEGRLADPDQGISRPALPMCPGSTQPYEVRHISAIMVERSTSARREWGGYPLIITRLNV